MLPSATYHALMLLLVPFCHVNSSTGEASPDVDDKKVFSTVVVFVHPSQQLSSIEEAVDMLLVVSHDPESVPVMVICHLPEQSIGEFYPCPTHNVALVLPFSMGQDGPILYLNTPIHRCNEFAVWHLHWWVHPYGPVVVLPSLYSPDLGLPNVYPLKEPPMLWTNTEYLAAASDDDVSEVGCPAMTLVSTSCLKVNASSSQISLTDDEFIQYVTIDIDAKGSTSTKSNEAAETGKPKVTLKKTKKDKTKGNAKDDGDSSSNSQDAGVYSDGEGQQLSHSMEFQGWSNDEAEGYETVAVANIVV